MPGLGILHAMALQTCTPVRLTDLEVDDLLESYFEDCTAFECCDPVPSYFGPFTGRGAQHAAAEAAKEFGVLAPMVVQVDRVTFYAFATSEARAEFLEAHRSSELIERVDCSRPFCPGLDMDGPETMPENDFEKICTAFTVTARTMGVDQPEPLIVHAQRSGKYSAHLIADGWQVADGYEGRKFYEAVRAACPEGLRKFIDLQAGPSARGASFGLRLPWVPKLDRDGTPVPHSILEPADFGCWVTQVAPWCLQGDPDAGPVYTFSPTPPAPLVPDPSTTSNDLEAFAERIAVNFPHFRRDTVPSAGSLLTYSRTASALCGVCDRMHDSDGAYVRRAVGGLWFNCRRADMPGARALLFHKMTPDALTDPDELPEPDELTDPDDMPTPEGVTTVDDFEQIEKPDEVTCQQFNAEAFASHIPAILEGGDTYVRAPWKTGKTVWAGVIVAKLIEYNPRARVLVITCRKTLSTTLVREFGAVDYRSIRGSFDDDAITRHPVSVWQVESLKRIPSDVLPFDLVIVDEPAALLAHVYQARANKAARTGLTMAKVLMRKAVRLYVSDNDLSTAHVDTFASIRPDIPRRVLVNSFQSWEGTAVDIIQGRSAPIEVRRRLFKFLDLQKEARDGGRPWSGAVVPCHSRKVANGIAQEARERYGSNLVKLYTVETDDAEKLRDFKDPTTAWNGMAVIVYTATVSVGVSANTDHITDAFAFFTSNNAGTGQSAQMVFRCRCLQRIAIAYNGQPIRGLPQTAEQLFEWATIAKNRHTIPDGFRGDRVPMLEQIQEDPDALGRAIAKTFEGRGWVCNQLEHYRSALLFVPRLIRILEASGCTVTTVEVRGGLTKLAEAMEVDEKELTDVATATAVHTRAADQVRNEVAAEVYPKAVGTFIDAINDGKTPDDDTRQRTADEHQGQRALYTVKTYVNGCGLEFEDVTALEAKDRTEWIAYHADPKKVEAYRNLTSIVRGVDQRFGPEYTGDTQTATASIAEASRIVRRTFEALDLGGALHMGADGVINVDKLRNQSDTLQDEALMAIATDINKHALRLFGDTHGSRKRIGLAKGTTPAKMVGTLNTALNYVGAVLSPEYDTDRKRARGAPDRYRLHWTRSEEKTPEGWEPAPAPCPRHPARIVPT